VVGHHCPDNSYNLIIISALRISLCLLAVFFSITSAMAGVSTESEAMSHPRIEEAITLMNHFAERTGLTTRQPPRRYLWTDAFAVCNYLGLARITGEHAYTERALQLVDQVHHTLGRHRDDEPRSGWISGLSEPEGEKHPTQGGLRIGKPLPERGPNEPIDERLEWDRDGQYFHYLTRWMHALDQVARATQQSHYNTWSRELARSAFHAFTYESAAEGQPRRMVWKMSIDLTRPQVPAMGQHDPLEGYITNRQLQATAATLPPPTTGPDLIDETEQFEAMIKGCEWATTDPLGLGGLMVDAYRLYQLRQGETKDEALIVELLTASLTGLRYYARSGDSQQPAHYRLAFRELGLAIGLQAVESMQRAIDKEKQTTAISPSLSELLKALIQYHSLREEIEAFWRNPEHQQSTTWTEHQDINEVMLATSLVPDGFLELLSPE
jgi:hypothetical protein